MRFYPILAAVLVSALIYLFIFDRETLTGGSSEAEDTLEATDQSQDESSAQDVASINVVALRTKARSIDSAIVLRGQTEADRQVDLRAETAGKIVSDPLRKGAFVETGDLLCEIEPGTRAALLAEANARLAEARARVPESEAKGPEAEARVSEAQAVVQEAKARLDEALINANAATELSKGGFASETRVASTQAAVRGAEAAVVRAQAGLKSAASGLESVAAGIEAAKAGVQSARAAVAAAEKEIDRLSITAPFAGLLESDTAELGSLLQPGDLCATVVQLDPVKLVGFVPETEVSRIELGAHAIATFASGQQVEGTVNFLSRVADPSTRTFRVEITVPNPDLLFRDGLSVEIVIDAEGKEAHLLPQSAMTLDDAGALGVRIVDDAGMVAFQPITQLRDTPKGIWASGLPPQADVIVIGQEFVTDGVKVAVSYQKADAEGATE